MYDKKHMLVPVEVADNVRCPGCEDFYIVPKDVRETLRTEGTLHSCGTLTMSIKKKFECGNLNACCKKFAKEDAIRKKKEIREKVKEHIDEIDKLMEELDAD